MISYKQAAQYTSEQMEERGQQALNSIDDELFKNKKGKKPHATSQYLGQLTAPLVGIGTTIGAGALIGSAVGGRGGAIVGGSLGGGIGTIGAAIIGLAISRKGARTKAQQDAYKNSSTLSEYLIPGVALGNVDRNEKTRQQALKKIPKELQGWGY